VVRCQAMKALFFDGEKPALRDDYAAPEAQQGWAVIRVRKAGVCRTDIELTRGYMAYRGVLGHEFVGVVEDCHLSDWVGRRVVGEINAACGRCDRCGEGLDRHCPQRRVLGILDLDGCMADYCTLPVANLHEVPADIADDRAVFTEPLSAAYEILDQVALDGSERCVVLGDGKLGILCAWVLATVAEDVTLIGHHPDKLEAARWRSLKTAGSTDEIEPGADLVVEATGSGTGLAEAMTLCRPRGVLVLKSTVADQGELNLAPIVVKEILVVGSRCGLFEHGLRGLVAHDFPVESLISARYPLVEGEEALEHAARRGVLKVLLEMEP
jgi:alcohol dehydrogenase